MYTSVFTCPQSPIYKTTLPPSINPITTTTNDNYHTTTFRPLPFTSHGHTTPLLHLSLILSDHYIAVTIITTPANQSTVKTTVQNHPISVINLPFPDNTTTTPPGVQVTETQTCMSSFHYYVDSMQQLQPWFEEVVRSLHPVSCIISDGFLFWTQDSADKLGIPRLDFYGMNIFSMTMCSIMEQFKPHAAVGSGDEAFVVPDFSRMKLTMGDFDPPLSEIDAKGPEYDFRVRQQNAIVRSHGVVVNSFYELEPEFNEYWNRNYGPKAWLVGPFCVDKTPAALGPNKMVEKAAWFQWLDMKLAANEPVLYVSFGSLAEASPKQLLEVANGLEQSNISFMWVVKPKQLQLIGEGFEERVKGRGRVVTQWVDQVEILNHEIVCGFLSHCGWKSVLESICGGVAILAMPLMADQHLNARMVVEEIGVGLRLWPSNMAPRGVVEAKEVAKMVAELMGREGGRRVRKRLKEVRESAYGAMKEGGSSSRTLDLLIDHVCGEGV